jgi:hypothetical protein
LISFSGRLVSDHGSTVFGIASVRIICRDVGQEVELKANRGLRNCTIGVRAEPYECGAPEALALELYPMERARMAIETPAVRP